MKLIKLLNTLLIISASLFVAGCSSQENKKTVYVKASDIIKETILVDGMTCLGCEITLEKEILKVAGVTKAKASSSDDKVVVEFDKTKTDKDGIVNAIKNAGYKAQE